MNNSQLKCHWPWFDLSMTSKVKFYQVNWKAIYDLLYVFHTNFHHTMYRFWDISWNRSQRSKWTSLTLKMTFRVILYLSYFRAGLVSQQRSYMMQYIWAALRYYWIISIIMGKWAKPDLSALENYLLNNSMKSISWHLINIIPKKLYIRYKIKAIRPLLRKLTKSSKNSQIWPLSDLLDLESDSIESIFWQSISTLLGKLLA